MKHVLLAALAAWCLGCEDEVVPPVYTSSVQLAVEDAGVTDVWFRMSFADSAAPRAFALRRDGATVLTGTVTGRDMIVGDTTAAPGHSYGYKVFRLNGTTAIDSSAVVQVTTLDSTSHIFSQLRIDTLGVTSSELRDVAIINDTLAYAVGEMYLRDSMGQIDPQAWNAAKWNGRNWTLKRIPFIGACSAVLYPPLKAIWAFSESNVLVTNGGSIVQYDGVSATMDCRMNSLLAGAINKIYAPSPQDIYAVGNAGTIVHYNGASWRRIESGTTVNLNDIWGSVDTRTGKRTVLCAATNILQGGEHKLLSIAENSTVDTVDWRPGKELWSVWFQSPARIFTAGEGLHVRWPDKSWREYTETPLIATGRIRGVGPNDLFAVGSFGLVLHYNGKSWHEYPQIAAADIYYSCDYWNGLLVTVGQIGQRALVAQMRR